MKSYHLSKKFLGTSVVLHPKIPTTSSIEIEGDIPRICFSSNVYYCVRSICGSSKIRVLELEEFKNKTISYIDENYERDKDDFILINPSIYVTKSKTYLPPACSDFRSNRERWALEQTTVDFIGFLCLKRLIDRKLVITDVEHTLDNITYLGDMYKYIFKPHSMKLI